MVEILVLYYDAIFKSFGFGFVLIRFLDANASLDSVVSVRPSVRPSVRNVYFLKFYVMSTF